MSAKISALPNAASLTGAELAVLVQSAADVKATLTAIRGFMNAIAPTQVSQAGGSVAVSGTGDILSQPAAGHQNNLWANGGTITIDGSGNIAIQNGTGVSVVVSFVDSTPASWLTVPPVDMSAAIHRIAVALNTLLGGGGIP
jgi:O-antigen ligase